VRISIRHYAVFRSHVLHFIDEDDQRPAGLLSCRPDCLQETLQVLPKIPVVGKASFWGEIATNFALVRIAPTVELAASAAAMAAWCGTAGMST